MNLALKCPVVCTSGHTLETTNEAAGKGGPIKLSEAIRKIRSALKEKVRAFLSSIEQARQIERRLQEEKNKILASNLYHHIR